MPTSVKPMPTKPSVGNGEVARLLTDTGLIVLSTTNPFSLPAGTVAQAIQTPCESYSSCHYLYVERTESLLPDATLTFLGPEDFNEQTRTDHRDTQRIRHTGQKLWALNPHSNFRYRSRCFSPQISTAARFTVARIPALLHHSFIDPCLRSL